MYSTSVTLLERVRQPADRAAWDRFVQLYTPFLFHCGRRLRLTESDAADLVQDVFILLLEKLPSFQYVKDGSFRAWLRVVITNKCRERFRKKSETAIGSSAAGVIDQLPANDSDELWDTEYQQHLIARALEIMQAEFEPTTWQACWQTTIEDKPVSEVAAALDITVNAVYVARSRVLRHLRRELRDLLDP